MDYKRLLLVVVGVLIVGWGFNITNNRRQAAQVAATASVQQQQATRPAAAPGVSR